MTDTRQPSVGRIVVLGPSRGPRHDSFAAACAAHWGAPPRTLSWDAFLAAPERLAALIDAGTWLRFDTPDQDVAALAALYGAGETAARAAGFATLAAADCARLARGELGSPAQFCFGLLAAIDAAAVIAGRGGALVSTTTGDVACAFDKTACLQRLREDGIPTPWALPAIDGFDALVAEMDAASLSRVFVKLRHGSAAAGMIALARHGDRWTAITTAECDGDGHVRATRNVARLTDRAAIAALVDRLAPLGLHVEAWLPKIGVAGRIADLRLVMIGEETVFPVLRTSRHPMTNLHLGGARASADLLVDRIGRAAWGAIVQTARRTKRCFADSQMVGIDLAVLPDGRRHAVLEVNAFGDFVKEIWVDGRDPHQAQVAAIADRLAAAQRAPAGVGAPAAIGAPAGMARTGATPIGVAA